MLMNSDSTEISFVAQQRIEEKKYWEKKLSGHLQVSRFPYSHHNDGNESRKAVETFTSNNELFSKLKKLSTGSDYKLHMIMAAILTILLNKYTGNSDIIIGMPIYQQDIESQFINTVLALRIAVQNHTTCRDLLLQVNKTIYQAVDNQNYPIERLVDDLNVPTSGNIFPLFEIAVLLENIQDKKYLQHINLSMTLSFKRTDEQIEGVLEYDSSLYHKETIKTIITHFNRVSHQMLDNINIKLSDINLLTGREKKQILFDFNATDAENPYDKPVHDLFAEQVERTPDNTAVVFQDQCLTYKELNNRSNKLARFLRNRGVKPDSFVAIFMERSSERIIGILGILKASGAYLALEPGLPAERLNYMMTDSGAGLLLTDMEGDEIHGIIDFKGEVIRTHWQEINRQVDTNMENINSITDLIYIIYTSGSTGEPKGILIEHKNAASFLNANRENFNLTCNDIAFQLTSISFDISVVEIFSMLLIGGKLVIPVKDELQTPSKIVGSLEKNTVTYFSGSPALLGEINKYPVVSSLRIMGVGGDILKVSDFSNYLGKIPVINGYGPTETTVCATMYQCWENNGNYIPLGKPIQNYKVYILDKMKKPVPVGIYGEIYISGDGVGRGYHNKSWLTEEKFLHDPFVPHMRMFKTGDLGRWFDDGNIEFLGRSDHQVKIRGYRIELGEIENRLLNHDHIKEAVVTVRGDETGEKYLCAYIVVNQSSLKPGQPFDNTQLKDYLSRQLPGYMIPTYFVRLEKMPLTTGGKVNRKALPDPDATAAAQEYVPPRNETEEYLAGIWEEVLGTEKISINDNFFDIGGNSMKIMHITNKLQEKNLELKLVEFYLTPTIKDAGKYIKSMERVIHQGIVEGEVPLNIVQRVLLEEYPKEITHFNIPMALYKKDGFKEEILKKLFTKIVEHHDALRMIYKVENGRVVQWNRGLEGRLFDLQVIDLRRKKIGIKNKIKKISNQIQRSIDLEKGPLVKLGLFKTNQGDHLAIVIHHFVIDIYSWQILLEDITTGYQQIEKEEEPGFPAKTDPVKYWTTKIEEYSQSKDVWEEIKKWKMVGTLDKEGFPKDSRAKSKKRINKNFRRIFIGLDKQETAALLKKVNKAYETEIKDILLAALGYALKEWRGVETVKIGFEGHGRDTIIKDLNVSRTVGFMTNLIPVLFDLSHLKDFMKGINYIKETLQHTQKKGLNTYLLTALPLKELNNEEIENQFRQDINLNYIDEIYQKRSDGPFEISNLSIGEAISPNVEKQYTIEIIGATAEGELQINFAYCKYEYKRKSIKKLADCYKSNLIKIIDHCCKEIERKGQ